MKKQQSRHIISLFLILLLTSFVLAACGSTKTESNPPTTQGQSAPATLDGATLVQERCTVCHDLSRIQQAQKSADEWTATVTRMVGKGAKLDQVEQEAVIQYLAQAYP